MTKTKKHIPMRRCAGCMESKPKGELVRIVDTGTDIKVDFGGRMNGRGMYICPMRECLDAAWKNNAVNRSFKRDLKKDELDLIYSEIAKDEKEV